MKHSLVLFSFLSLMALSAGCSPADPGEQSLSMNETQPLPDNPADTIPASTNAASDAVFMEKMVLRDPARGNMPAIELLVPREWEVDGGINPVPPAYGMIPYMADVTVKAPDKRAVRFYGNLEFGYADGIQLQAFTPYHGRPFMPLFQSLGDFWLYLVKVAPHQDYTDVKVISEERLPELTEMVQKHLSSLYRNTQQENMQLQMTGQRKSFDVHARKLVIQYKDKGTPVEATIFATVRHAIYHNPGGSIRAAMWNLDNMYAVAGPVGSDYLNDPELAAIVRSKRNRPEWDATIQEWYLRKNQQIVREGQARIAAAARQAATTRSSNSEDILDMSFNSWKRRNDMNSAGHASSINSIHEQTTYAQPSGGTVNLPSYYQNVYTDRLGNYILHNDANYEINTDPNVNSREWTRIEPVR